MTLGKDPVDLHGPSISGFSLEVRLFSTSTLLLESKEYGVTLLGLYTRSSERFLDYPDSGPTSTIIRSIGEWEGTERVEGRVRG